jgi:hypothetical protein
MEKQKILKKEKKSQYIHRGFDFDGEEGHDELVVGSIMKKLQVGIQNQVFLQLNNSTNSAVSSEDNGKGLLNILKN